MARVLVDTNVVGGAHQRPLENNVMRRLLDETRRGNLKLVVPEVVVREAANLWAEKVGEQIRAVRSAQFFLLQAGLSAEEPHPTRDLGLVREAEEDRLRERISGSGGQIAPLPGLDHDEVIERALSRRQPFDSNGRGGYRDVLVWESLLELDPAEGAIIFLARDKRAFFEEGKSEKGLAVSLRREIERSAKSEVALFFDPERGIAAALTKGVEEESQAAERAVDEAALTRLNDLLASDQTFSQTVSEDVSEALEYIGLGGDLRPYGIADAEVYDAYVDAVASLEEGCFLSAHVAEDGAVLAKFAAKAILFAEAAMQPSVAALLAAARQVYVRDPDVGSGMASAQIALAADIRADLVIEVDSSRLLAPATITSLEPPSPDRGAERPSTMTESNRE